MASFYNLSIHSGISEFPTERRYNANIKISELKQKLELITGANHKTMKLSLTLEDGSSKDLNNDEEALAHYAGASGDQSTLKLVVSDDSADNILGGDVPKYSISDEKYQERQNNARNFIKEMRQKRLSEQGTKE